MSDPSKLTKDEGVAMLIKFIEQAHRNKGFELHETEPIMKAVNYLKTPPEDADSKEAKQQEVAYVNTLFQAAQLGNSRGGFPALEDSHYVYRLLLALKDKYDPKPADASSAESSSGTSKKYKSKTQVPVAPEEDEEEDVVEDASEESEEETPVFQERTVKGKGKARA